MTDGIAVTRREKEFEALCLAQLYFGIKPTPASVGGGPRFLEAWEAPDGVAQWVEGFGNGRTIRGNYVKIRTRLLEEHGYRKDHSTDRWVK